MEKESYFNKIYKDHKDKIYRICCFYLQDQEDRNDLFQEVLANVWRGLDRFEGRSKISTWIYRISVNTSMAFFKQQFKEIDKRNKYEQEISNDTTDSSHEDEQNKIDQLHLAISGLSKMEKAIVSLLLEELSHKEIAEIIGLSENNIRVKIHRIKSKLKSILKTESHGNR